MTPLLEVCGLSASVKKDGKTIKILDDINFSINEGEILGLAGESGCGKSMTALSISSLLPQAVNITGGKIIFNGKDVTHLGEEKLRGIRGNEISVIFQDSRQALNPLMKVGSQITETLELGGKKNMEENKTLALETLASLGFNNPQRIFNAFPHQLSGGMCQRVMTAIAVIRRPKLLLADEPSSSLDEESQKRCLSLLLERNQKDKMSLLVISHDLSIIRQFCNRYIVMSAGKIIEEGHGNSLPANPYTRELPQNQIGASSAETLLSVKNVSNVYTGHNLSHFAKIEKKPVLNNVNLEIRPGEIFGLTGKSGCGKTTLARCILGLVDYEGEILIDGQKPSKAAHRIQMIFQDPGASLNPTKKIGWLIEEPLHIHKIGAAEERRNKVDKMLLRVGLNSSYKTRRVHELSGGQKQRVCIARALILEPRLLIADEAISSLDVSAGVKILNLFRKLNKNSGLGILFISHNKDAVEYLCNRVAVMEKGHIEKNSTG